MIDGIAVNVGDSVYVLTKGNGVVHSVNSGGSFTVRFGSSTISPLYSSTGYLGSVRYVYWQDPVIVPPTPNVSFWAAYSRTTRSLYAELMRLAQEGKVEYEDVE